MQYCVEMNAALRAKLRSSYAKVRLHYHCHLPGVCHAMLCMHNIAREYHPRPAWPSSWGCYVWYTCNNFICSPAHVRLKWTNLQCSVSYLPKPHNRQGHLAKRKHSIDFEISWKLLPQHMPVTALISKLPHARCGEAFLTQESKCLCTWFLQFMWQDPQSSCLQALLPKQSEVEELRSKDILGKSEQW